ncbi:MAG: hypothetical protein QOJ39_1356, partial [Candidatus Eremiobacteraeota bacterium]|nr:hypothetical protein [Candidatus Eremiobacteraeota bacterium]
MHGFVKAQSRAFVRRTLTIAAVATGLMLAWTHGGFASGPLPPYEVDDNGVIRTIGHRPYLSPT